MSPLVSIIIPVYNVEHYIERCIRSLQKQTLQNIEFVFVNDGSTDSSLDILKKYAETDHRVKSFSQSNKGPAAARNLGLDSATGKYIMFCDADDWYEPCMCEDMFNAIEDNQTDIALCKTYFEFETQNGINDQKKKRRIQEDYFNPSYYEGKHLMDTKVRKKTNVLIWNKIFKRELIDKYMIRFPNGHEHDDDAFWYMYTFVSESIFFLDKKLYHYFIRGNSIMDLYFQKKQKNRFDRLLSTDFVLVFLVKWDLLKKYISDFSHLYQNQVNQTLEFLSDEEYTILKNTLAKNLNDVAGHRFYVLFLDRYYIYIAYSIPSLIKGYIKGFEFKTRPSTKEKKRKKATC